jgi:hypothetical protein
VAGVTCQWRAGRLRRPAHRDSPGHGNCVAFVVRFGKDGALISDRPRQIAVAAAMSPSDAEMILLAILTVASYSVVGLLAIWAGLGRPHWFLRVAVVGGILLLLLLIPAYEPLLLFSIQSAVVILPLMLLKGHWARVQAARADAGSQTAARVPLRPQFSVSDLLLLTVVVAIAMAVGLRVPSDAWKFWDFVRDYVQGRFDSSSPWLGGATTPAQGWTAFFFCGVALGISTLAAAWVGLGRRRLWLRLISLFLIPTCRVMAAWLAFARASGWLASGRRKSAMASRSTNAGRPKLRRSARLAAVVLSLLILLPPAATLCVLAAPRPRVPEIVLPDPNGYDDLLKAGEALAGLDVPGGPMSLQEALDTARTGLDRECVVPPEYSMSDSDVRTFMALRALARAFLGEGQVAEMNGRPADAVRSYLDLFRLGQAGTRGGLPIHWLVGRAIDDIGLDALIGLRKMLTPHECGELIDTLQTLDANREPVEDVLARKQIWLQIALDWKEQLMRWLSMIAGTDSDLRPILQEGANRNQAKLRLLICGLALRSYCLEKGQPAEKLADLVPDYLSEMPQDPYSGKPLVYRREATGYVLYSVGSDGQDDGGQPWDDMNWSGDILLDEPAKAP